MKAILLINGPNLNMLGKREPDIYGKQSLRDVEEMVIHAAQQTGIEVLPFQSNHEGAIIDFIQENYERAAGIIINPGALTHYSYALHDCLAGTGLSVIEVHISDINNREEWRKKSVIRDVCAEVISGRGVEGYLLALKHFTD
ncbi:MAG: type II 3-dehydroquinate dehydratase [Candidatus Zixiibacteriota bacterium]